MKAKKAKSKARMTRRPQGRGRQALPRARTASAPRPAAVIEGVFSGAASGYGFVSAEGLTRDIFIPWQKTGGALDGDLVRCRYRIYTRDGIERTEGEILAIVEAVRKTVVGTLRAEAIDVGRRRSVRYYIEADDTHFSTLCYLDDIGDAQDGDKVEALLPPRRSPAAHLVGQFLRSFGPAASRRANYAAILASCEIPTAFSDEELAEAERMAALPLSLVGRTDLRSACIMTIDGAGAKDLDDAISLERASNGNYLLGVHIADVSTYVRPRGALDACALSRGTSVYFTDQVVPMLPPALSNGACSLNAGEDKYALSCTMELTPAGAIVRASIARTLIRSSVRGVYAEVNDLLASGTSSPFYEKYRAVLPMLTRMHELYTVLAEKSRRRGSLDLEQTEAEILLDERGDPVDILPRTRGDAERMIEQFMLAANESVATLLAEKRIPCVFRVHDAPDPERLADFLRFAHNLDLPVGTLSAEAPDGRALSALLSEARERGLGEAVSYTLLRTMAKARYSEICHPHFGLGIEKYCHFTSPIRRLSDLATHRVIEAVLLDGEAPQKYASYVSRAALAASEAELRALTAERRIDALYKAIYLSKRIGETYPATISSVTRFGAFAALANTCEGLIPLSSLLGAWTFDEGNLLLRSAAGDRIRLGDRVTVSVESVDIARGKVSFGLVALPPRTAEATPAEAPSKTQTPSAPAASVGRSGNGKKSSNRPSGGKASGGKGHGGSRGGKGRHRSGRR